MRKKIFVSSIPYRSAVAILRSIPQLGPKTFLKIYQFLGKELGVIFSWTEKDLREKLQLSDSVISGILRWEDFISLEQHERQLRDYEARFVAYDDEGYPPSLLAISQPPIGLYLAGKALPDLPLLAIVGSRECTVYGWQQAHRFGNDLARMGYGIVSGVARGVDAAAHQGAIMADGYTIGVLAGGLDVVYPKENANIYEAIREHGTLLTECPFGQKIVSGSFPLRNRLIVGLSAGLLVIETRKNGGSMISVDYARQQEKPILALPGNVSQRQSEGCHELIRSGARLVTSASDVVADLQKIVPMEFSFLSEKNSSKEDDSSVPSVHLTGVVPELSDAERPIWESLRNFGKSSAEEISHRIQQSVLETARHLQLLQIRGVVRKDFDGKFSL